MAHSLGSTASDFVVVIAAMSTFNTSLLAAPLGMTRNVGVRSIRIL